MRHRPARLFSVIRPVFPALCVTCLICLACLIGVPQGLASFDLRPAMALVMAQKGIDDSDPTLFHEAVDSVSIVNKAADKIVNTLPGLLPADMTGNPLASASFIILQQAAAAGQTEMVAALLASEVRTFVATGISSGYFAGKPGVKPKAAKGTLASQLRRLPEGRRVLTAGKVLANQGDSAVMEATLTEPGRGAIPLVLGLEKRNNRWKVVEIVNAADLLREAVRGKR